MAFEVDPDDPLTWGPTRKPEQIIAIPNPCRYPVFFDPYGLQQQRAEWDAAKRHVAAVLDITEEEAGERLQKVWTERPVTKLEQAADIVIAEGDANG